MLYRSENPIGPTTVDLHNADYERAELLPGLTRIEQYTVHAPPLAGQHGSEPLHAIEGDMCRRCDSVADADGSGLCSRCRLSDIEGGATPKIPSTIHELNIGDRVTVAGYQSAGTYTLYLYGNHKTFTSSRE